MEDGADNSGMFAGELRSAGDLAGVFEYTDDTGYYYLYRQSDEGNRILGANHILSVPPDFAESDLEIRWNQGEDKVGLLIRGVLWAVFAGLDATSWGGDYVAGGTPQIPPEIAAEFSD